MTDFITHIQAGLEEALPEIIRQYNGEKSAGSLSEMEQAIKHMSHRLGNEIMRQWLKEQAGEYPADEHRCGCGKPARYVRRRSGVIISLQGRVDYRRAYYLCEHCQQGHYPLDDRLGIKSGEMSEEVIRQAALLGIEDAFETSSQKLAELTLLELSPNSIRKASLVMGERVHQQEQAQFARSQRLDSQLEQRRVSAKPERLYGSMDGFMVCLEDGWHEMKAGAWWTTSTRKDGTLKAQHLAYYADLLAAEDFSDLVWATGFERLADQAKELVFVADGADWIWRIVERHFPQAVQIVDWYHACQYLAPLALLAFSDPDERQRWMHAVKDLLWEGRIDEVIDACSQQTNSARPDDPARKAVTYYTNNRQRMDYAAFRAQGYMIGSGSMESGCKQIGFERLKIAGARWSVDGARKVAKARAAFLSKQWHTLTPDWSALSQVA
jgi:hypothetical protein